MPNPVVQSIEALLGRRLHEAPVWPAGPLLGLMAFENNKPKYRLDASGALIGLNLAKTDLDDARWAQLLQIIEPAALRALNLSDNALSRLELPAGMQALEQLSLNGNDALTRFSLPPGGLPVLQRLDANECAFSELTLPAGMNALQALNLRFGKLERLEVEADCPALEVLDTRDNALQTLSLPTGFARLWYLNADRNRLASLRFARPLPALESLWLKGNRLEALDFLRKHPRLDSLYLHDNQIRQLPENLLVELPALQVIYLKGNPIENLERELLDRDENVFDNLRSILLSRSKGTMENNEVKLILVGNSTVGKTSLDIFLRERSFQQGENSTHGIRVNHWEPRNKQGEKTGLQVYIWDFGGQEYYHATHRLFLNNHALYCLLWNKSTDVQAIVPTPITHDGRESVEDLEHYPHTYWIQNIRHYAADSPILLVQSRDTAPKELGPAVFEKYRIQPARTYHVCLDGVAAQQEQHRVDFDVFETALTGILQEKAAHYRMGRYWFEIKQTLRQRAEQGAYRMSLDEFSAFCRGIDPSMEQTEMDTLRTYLKEIGVILFYPGYEGLEETVFIEPTWVTRRIYEVFDAKVKADKGKFDRAHVAEALERHQVGKDAAERAVLSGELLGLMKAFELIFSPADRPDQFYAIQYLPNAYPDAAALGIMKKATPEPGFALHFPDFLPKSVFHRFIAAYGKYATDVFWKYGVCFTHARSGSQVFAECLFTEKIIRVWVQKRDEGLLSELFQKLLALNEGNRDLQVSLNEDDFVPLDKLEEALKLGHARVIAANGQAVEVAGFSFIREAHFHSETADVPAPKRKPKIFISYAHKNEGYKDEIEAILKTLKEQDLVETWNDRRIEAGEWDPQIRAAMESADIFILAVTNDFINSDYIGKTEISTAYQRYLEGKSVIVPVIFEDCPWELKPVSKKHPKEWHEKEEEYLYPWLSKFQAYPTDAKPVEKWPLRNEALKNVFEALKSEIRKIRQN